MLCAARRRDVGVGTEARERPRSVEDASPGAWVRTVDDIAR